MTYALETLATLYIFWLLFIIYAGAVAAWRNLHIVQRVLLLPLAVPAAALDVLVNLTLATVVFLRLPPVNLREAVSWSLTYRLTQYKKVDDWRGKISTWVCNYMLDPFQHGHCS